MKNHIKKFTCFNEKISGFPPYDYQAEVAAHLLAGKNVILSVPTGAGKTWASIMPFLFARQENLDFPQKMIYSLPLRALCNSISEDVNKAIKNTAFDGLTSVQTGEFSDDKYFEKDIIFSTIDQTLSNFLCFPLPLSQRQANINAGALIGCYLVFDEFHLLDGQRSMATALGMLRMLGRLSRFCIMTATLSDDFMDKLQGALNNVEIVTLDSFDEDISKIGSLIVPEGKTSKKKIEIAEGVIRAKEIKENHDDKTIVICNRVETAQRVYLELEEWAKEKDINLICLHSRFFDSDRKRYESQLKGLFGKDVKDKKTNAILISTQVIEAGMDISCEVMHIEIAPINALLQRVGRCARYTGEYGKIFVYDVLDEEEKAKIEIEDFSNLSEDDKKEIRKLKNKYLPYPKLLCEATLKKLKLPENQQLNEEVTIRLVNEILTETEQKTLEQLEASQYKQERIQASWLKCEKNFYREMIRDIQSIEVVLADNPSEVERFPYAFESVSMFKWSIVKWIKDVLETVDLEEDWVVGIVEENYFLGDDLDDGEANLKFREIKDIETVKTTFNTLFLNKKHFYYQEKIGLNKMVGDQKSPRKEWKKKEKELFAYQKDTFIQHTKGLLGAFEQHFSHHVSFSQKAFSLVLGTEIALHQLIQLTLILHDYGKLDNAWQNWMQAYQKELSLIPNSMYTYEQGVPLGHTGFNSREEKVFFDATLERLTKEKEQLIFKQRGKRPAHAGVGAKVIVDVLNDWYNDNEDIALPASMAVARHHSPFSDSYSSFEVSSLNYQAMQQLLEAYNIGDVELDRKGKRTGKLDLVESSQFEAFLLYLYLVRILRLCDQKATDDFERYLK